MLPRIGLDNGNMLLEKEDLKKDGKKPGLYRFYKEIYLFSLNYAFRFKDEVEGDKEFQLKNLNLLFKKEGASNFHYFNIKIPKKTR